MSMCMHSTHGLAQLKVELNVTFADLANNSSCWALEEKLNKSLAGGSNLSFIPAGIQQSRLGQKSKTVKVVRKFRWLLIEPSGVLGPPQTNPHQHK